MMKQLINNELHFDGFRNKFGMTGCAEQGRSMVEMLGVLAVIGVLSVAGIAGYSNAMNKYRANELIYEANKRAVVLAMQIAQGKTGTLSIDEFINNKIGTAEFKNPTYTAGADTFTMTLTGVNEAVCNQMKTSAGENGGLKINGNCGENLILTFKKDLSNEITSTPSGPSMVENCSNGTSTSNFGDITNEQTEEGNCRCPEDEPQWDGQKCKEADTENECGSVVSQECPEGYYCKFSPSDCSNIGKGTCTKITGGNTSNGYAIGPQLDWWSANSWCVAKTGNNLVSGTINEIPLNEFYMSFDGNGPLYQALETDGSFWVWNEPGNFCSPFKIDVSSSFEGVAPNDYNGDPSAIYIRYSALCASE